MRFLIVGLLVVALIGGGYIFYTRMSAPPVVALKTSPVTKGDLVTSISATGTIEPEEVVDVGAQVNGPIVKLGEDPKSPDKMVGWDSVVQKDQVLAQVDDTMYRAQVDLDKAKLDQDRAQLQSNQAKLDQAEKDWVRAQKLILTKSIADLDYDTAKLTYETAKDSIPLQKAVIAQDEALLKHDQTNLDYCTIRSPVKGSIIDRRVNVGQTVVSALSTSSMFLIAKDLTRLQIWASVNEADVGQIRVGQPVSFTVDAFSGQQFHGEVSQIRLNATMTQNVVTYTVVVTTDNSNGKLLPYLTTNLKFELERHNNVLQVPSMALKWHPTGWKSGHHGAGSEQASATPSSASPGEAGGKTAEAGGKTAEAGQKAPADASQTAKVGTRKSKKEKSKDSVEHGLVWVLDSPDATPHKVRVQLGISDGLTTEVTSPDLQEGMEVVTGEARPTDLAADQTTNPFMPKLFSGKGSQGQKQGDQGAKPGAK
jgi:HlyD family secretion protein